MFEACSGIPESPKHTSDSVIDRECVYYRFQINAKQITMLHNLYKCQCGVLERVYYNFYDWRSTLNF